MYRTAPPKFLKISMNHVFLIFFTCSNYTKIEEELTNSTHLVDFPCHNDSWKLEIPQAHLDTLCYMIIGHVTFPSFLQPTFWQCHWSPCHMDIYNSQISDYQFRKSAILFHFILSKSLLIMHDFSLKLYKCILFYCIKLIISQFSIYLKFLTVYDHVLWD